MHIVLWVDPPNQRASAMFYLCVKIQRQVQGGGVHQRVASKEEKEERQLFADKFQPSSGEQEDNSPDKVSSSAERSSLIIAFPAVFWLWVSAWVHCF